MKTASFCSLVALAQAPFALAQGLRQATGGVGDASYTHQWYPVPTEEVSDCEAKLITTLCDYKEPLSGTAVAASGPKNCWEFCNEHQPCNFVIFVAGNPYTGTGTCWLYPGEDFDPSEGKEGCDYMSVFDKPVCAGDATPTSGACEATSSPSAVAEVCDYPTPDEKCWDDCTASSGAVDCLSQCVEADSCNFAVFNPHNEMESQYYSGSCWMYPEGKFDKSKAKTCKGKPEQYVYENPCPKPKPSTTTSSSSAARTSSSSGDGDSSASSKNSKTGAEGADQDKATEGDDKSSEDGDDDNGSMMVGVSLSGAVAAGLAVLLWQGIQ